MGHKLALLVGLVFLIGGAVVTGMSYMQSKNIVLKLITYSGKEVLEEVATNVNSYYDALKEKALSGATLLAKGFEGGNFIVLPQKKIDIAGKKIPLMVVSTPRGENVALTGNLELVDKLKSITGDEYTIFQVVDINGQKVMLRVATTIKKNGKRILGTYIGPDSKVYKTVIEEKKTYVGYNLVEGIPFVGTYKPVFASDGKVYMVSFCGTSLRRLVNNIINMALQKGSYGIVFSESGIVMGHPFVKAGSKVPEVAPYFWKAFKKAYQEAKGEKVFYFDYVYRGKSKVAFVTKMKDIDWFLCLAVDEDVLMSPIVDMRNRIFMVSLILLVVGVISGYIVVKKIISSLGIVVSSAKAIAMGDLTVDVKGDINSKNEIEQVLGAFKEIVVSYKSLITKMKDLGRLLSDNSDKLLDISDVVESSANEVAKASGDMVSIMASISSAAEETNAGIEEVAAESQRVAETTANVKEKALEVGFKVEKGSEFVEDVAKKIVTVGESSKEVAESINSLENSVEKIVEFVDIITNIADQTNLLALNAAIEAARAGEVGRGFAVVAEEVRKLAEEANKAASEINAIISEVKTKVKKVSDNMKHSITLVNDTVSTANETASKIKAVVKEIEDLIGEIETIASASQEQSASIEEMAAAMDNVVDLLSQGDNVARSVDLASQKVLKQAARIKEISEAQLKAISELTKLLERYKIKERSSLEKTITPV